MTRTTMMIFLVAAVIEYYSFMLVHSVVNTLPHIWSTVSFSMYMLLTCTIWIIIPFFRKINWEHIYPWIRDPFVALCMGVVIGKLIIALLLLAEDLRRTAALLINRIGETHFSTGRSPVIIQAAAVMGILAVIGLMYGMTKRYNYRVVNVKLRFTDLPAGFKNFRIVQISDIHTGSFDNYTSVQTGISKVMDQQADIILFTGDLVNNRANEVTEKYKEIFSGLRAPFGVYSILGNHDYGDYVSWNSPEAKKANLEKLVSLQKQIGWKLLLNEHVILERGGDRIGLIGIENWSARSSFPQYGKLAEACAGLSRENTEMNILMSHDPSHWHAQVLQHYPEISLTLSGHTHGMQLGVENKWFKWSPVQYFYQQWAGLYRHNKQYLYVNRGFGFLTYPGRIGIMPEITVIDLV